LIDFYIETVVGGSLEILQ